MADSSSPSIWIELVKSIPGIVTAGTAVAGVWIASLGLNRWHQETTGKRKVELAEQVLVDFYRARDAISWARSRGILSDEGKVRQGTEHESQELKELRDRYFTPVERLHKERELFARLNAQRYVFAAYFGQASGKPFELIMEAHTEIASAASILVDMATEHMTPAMLQQDMPLRNIIGWGTEKRPDAIDGKIDEAVKHIERLCGPVLEGKSK
jgi:hypothetical protein